MREHYLAVDIVATSGWHILGSLEEGKLHLEEIYRFFNSMEHRDSSLRLN